MDKPAGFEQLNDGEYTVLLDLTGSNTLEKNTVEDLKQLLDTLKNPRLLFRSRVRMDVVTAAIRERIGILYDLVKRANEAAAWDSESEDLLDYIPSVLGVNAD
jgi:hypothetical protein